MADLRGGKRRTEAGEPRMDAKRRAAEDLARRAHRLKSELAGFKRTARKLHAALEPEVSDAEVEVMKSPQANLLGTLECLVSEDVGPLTMRLDELDALLQEGAITGT
jgi:hypothetical protein